MIPNGIECLRRRCLMWLFLLHGMLQQSEKSKSSAIQTSRLDYKFWTTVTIVTSQASKLLECLSSNPKDPKDPEPRETSNSFNAPNLTIQTCHKHQVVNRHFSPGLQLFVGDDLWQRATLQDLQVTAVNQSKDWRFLSVFMHFLSFKATDTN